MSIYKMNLACYLIVNSTELDLIKIRFPKRIHADIPLGEAAEPHGTRSFSRHQPPPPIRRHSGRIYAAPKAACPEFPARAALSASTSSNRRKD